MMNVSRRIRGQRGNSMIELGFVILPMFGLLFLTMDLALFFFTRSTLQHAVREGVRFAVTSRTLNGMYHDASIRKVVKDNAITFLREESLDSLIQIRYFRPDTLERTEENSGGNIVEISVEGFQYQPMAPLLHKSDLLRFSVRSSDRMEMQPGGTAPIR